MDAAVDVTQARTAAPSRDPIAAKAAAEESDSDSGWFEMLGSDGQVEAWGGEEAALRRRGESAPAQPADAPKASVQHALRMRHAAGQAGAGTGLAAQPATAEAAAGVAAGGGSGGVTATQAGAAAPARPNQRRALTAADEDSDSGGDRGADGEPPAQRSRRRRAQGGSGGAGHSPAAVVKIGAQAFEVHASQRCVKDADGIKRCMVQETNQKYTATLRLRDASRACGARRVCGNPFVDIAAAARQSDE
jgi:hypothetical protein